ncbi:hypothetical protein PR048_001345 [Dryococelus australis]|uniref:Uncharacterized protein n=1 Tax=Dryococelus australis TaxID=614101 RepID=A0ABQ9IIG7_9NEOP|nr:hypothetical protein PR048_001345 [Dryococelus australis]
MFSVPKKSFLMRGTAFSLSTDCSNDSNTKLYPVVTYYSDEILMIESSVLCILVLNGDSTGLNIASLEPPKQKSVTLDSYKIPKLTNTKAVSSDSSSTQLKRSCRFPTPEPKSQKSVQQAVSGTKCGGNLSREERLFMFLTSKLNKEFCLFLQNVSSVIERPNEAFQSHKPQIHKLRSIRLIILTRFVKPVVVKSSVSVLGVNYHNQNNQKEDSELIIGNLTSRTVAELKLEEKVILFSVVREFFVTACDYMLYKFPLKNYVVVNVEVAQINT